MSFDLHLKAVCGGCGSASDLYGSNCKHMTLCMSCGKKMAQIRQKCFECGVPVTRLIREYNVRTTSANDKSYFIGRFVAGLPTFSKKKNSDKTWTIQKEGLQGRSNVTDSLRDKFKNRPWLLEDESGQFHYHGMLEGAQSATYYLLVMQGKEFVAIPAGSWYNFSKVAQYKQLTLEEAEEKMKNRRKTADGYERWMMKASIADKEGGVGTGSGSGRGRKKASADDEDGNDSDRGDEDEQDDDTRKSRVVRNKKTDDDDGEGRRGGDHDFDDDDVEKGDDWEHEEIFTDDDEAVGNDPEEREDLAPEVPAPPEIKQDEEDEDDEANEEEGTGLSKSGKEIKKLLGRMNDSDAEDDDDDDDDDDETGSSPVLAPKKKDPAVKEEPTDTTPSKPAVASSKGGTPSTSKSTKGKRKPGGDDVKVSNGTPPPKKVKTENETNKPGSTNNGSATPKEAQAAASGPVTEEEIRAVLMQKSPVTTQDLVAKFKSRLKSPRDKQAFADILKKISKIQKTNGASFVVLRDK